MGRVLLASIVLISLWSCQPETEEASMQPIETAKTDEFVRNPIEYERLSDSSRVSKFSFDKTLFSFDTIDAGEVVEASFRFVNNGQIPLEIYDARTTCGCTVPDYPNDPVMVGDSAEIKVQFNSADKFGFQDKPVVLIANTLPRRTTIRMQGFVRNDLIEENIQK